MILSVVLKSFGVEERKGGNFFLANKDLSEITYLILFGRKYKDSI